jgi:hypothetical protein
MNVMINTIYNVPGLLNSVYVMTDGRLLIANGNNRVILFDTNNSKSISYGGSEGMGEGAFKEPVCAKPRPDNYIYIADWHNHRVVILTSDLKFSEEFGCFGSMRKGLFNRFKDIVWYFKILGLKGSYIKTHFDIMARCKKKISFSLFANGMTSRIALHDGFINWLLSFKYENRLNKPNGFAFNNNIVAITQKNNKCISFFDFKSNHKLVHTIYKPTPGQSFGRLGNIYFSDDIYYVCDEYVGKIWRFSSDFLAMPPLSGGYSGVEGSDFLPFSCVKISKNMLAVCGGRNFQIIDLINNATLYISKLYGELHGIDFCSKSKCLFVADRKTSNIFVFDIDYEA